MGDRPWLRRMQGALRVSAATLGTLLIATIACVALARFVPMQEEDRFTIGFALVTPLWIAAMCVAFVYSPISAGRGARPGPRCGRAPS